MAVEMRPGWSGDIRGVRRVEDLPAAAREYLARIEELVGVPVTIVGTGPDRSETLLRGEINRVFQRSRGT